MHGTFVLKNFNLSHLTSVQNKITSHKSRQFTPNHYTSHHFTYLRSIPTWIPWLVTIFLILFNILNPLSPESSTFSVFLCLLLSVHSSLIFRGFLFCRFANSRCRRNNKNMSLGPFSEQEHQNCLTTRPGLRAIPQDVPRSWKKNRSRSHYSVSAKKTPLPKKIL